MADETQEFEYAAALAQLGWDAYVIGQRRVVRSPDRRLFILHDYCSSRDIIEIVHQWKPLPKPPGH